MRYPRLLVSSFVGCAIIACGGPEAARTDSATAPTQIALEQEVRQACEAVAVRLRSVAATVVEIKTDSFPEFTGTSKRAGCVVHAEGTLGGVVTIPYLARALPDSLGPGWMRDSAMVADGPRGTAYAVTRGDVQCLFRINWTMRVRYDTKADPAPYTANVGCAATPGRGSAP